MQVAVLGAGQMGETVIGQLKKSPRVERIVAQDLRPERVAELRAKHGVDGTATLD